MKTPEEIKKGLWCCYGDSDRRHCEKCPHGAKVEGYTEIMCVGFDRNGEDALALIRQLESKLANMTEDFADFANAGIYNRAPFCENKTPVCINSYGRCIDSLCDGFVPKVRDE